MIYLPVKLSIPTKNLFPLFFCFVYLKIVDWLNINEIKENVLGFEVLYAVLLYFYEVSIAVFVFSLCVAIRKDNGEYYPQEDGRTASDKSDFNDPTNDGNSQQNCSNLLYYLFSIVVSFGNLFSVFRVLTTLRLKHCSVIHHNISFPRLSYRSLILRDSWSFWKDETEIYFRGPNSPFLVSDVLALPSIKIKNVSLLVLAHKFKL